MPLRRFLGGSQDQVFELIVVGQQNIVQEKGRRPVHAAAPSGLDVPHHA